jgi:hypothetical protein
MNLNYKKLTPRCQLQQGVRNRALTHKIYSIEMFLVSSTLHGQSTFLPAVNEAGSSCIEHKNPRAASLPGRSEEMKS